MNARDQINQAIHVFLQRIDQGDDAQRLVRLFAGSPQSALALAVSENATYLARHNVKLRVVFAGAGSDARSKLIDALRSKFAAGAVSVRATSYRDYAGHHEQLVLGTTCYITGSTITPQAQAGRLDDVYVSDADDEVATATFAFDLLWDTGSPATQRRTYDGSAGRMILSLVGFAGLFGKVFTP